MAPLEARNEEFTKTYHERADPNRWCREVLYRSGRVEVSLWRVKGEARDWISCRTCHDH